MGRLGLQVWLVAAFVFVGAVASLAVLLVVLPTLESSVLSEAADSEARAVGVTLGRNRELVGPGPGYDPQAVTDLVAGVAAEIGGTARFTGSGGGQARGAADPESLALPQPGVVTPVGIEVARGGPPQVRVENTGDARVVSGAVLVTQAGQAAGVLEVSVPVTTQAGEIDVVRRRVFLAVAAVLLLASLAGWGLSRVLGRRIAGLARTATKLSSGDLAARAPESNPREVATLASSLNRMAGRLQELVGDVTSERDRARGLIGSLAEGVLAVDPEGRVTAANGAAERLLGIPRGGEASLDDLPARVALVVREVLADPDRTPQADEARLAEGTEVELQVGPLTDRTGGVVVTVRDVTDERRLERARRDLVANVSHELKTPLSALKGFLELLEGEGLDEARRREFLALMSQETHRLERLVEEQLELARLDAGALRIDPQDVDLGELAREVGAGRRPLAEREGILLVVDAPPAGLVARVDPARVEQILLILLDNAVRHTARGGRIDLVATRDGDEATIAVADTGEGIAEDAQAKVFDRFYQADPSREGRGTGLGLAIARGLARAHGGGIDLASVPGVGSTFTLRLPLSSSVTGSVAPAPGRP